MSEYINVPKSVLQILFPKKSSRDSVNLNKIIHSFEENKSILIYGAVQSGKTSNLINFVEKITFDSPYLIIYLTGLKNNLLIQNLERFSEHFEKINEKIRYRKYYSSAKERSTKASIISIKKILDDGNSYITSELKNPGSLENLYKLIKNIDKNVLIIDDEADEASLAPKTNSSIQKIVSLPNVKLVSITATPYLNLYKYKHLYDDLICLEPGVGYDGISSFKDNYIKIPSIDDGGSKIFIETIVQPICYWAVVATEIGLEKSQILFNPSLLTEEHSETLKKINLFLNDYNLIYDLFKSGKITEKAYSFLNGINSKSIVVSNSNVNNEILEYENEKINEGHKIIIGGGNLSRGISYNNLIVEVMLNSPKDPNPAVILQRARWFGYRGKLKKYIKIYTTEEIIQSMNELEDLDSMLKTFDFSKSFKEEFDKKNYRRLRI